MENEIKHLGGKLRRLGPNQCTESELLAIVINTGTKGISALEIAQNILDKFGSFYDLQGKTLNEIMEIKGIGPTKATQIAAVFALCQRVIIQMERR